MIAIGTDITSRATVIVDKAGKVAWAQNHGLGTPRDDNAMLDALKKLGCSRASYLPSSALV